MRSLPRRKEGKLKKKHIYSEEVVRHKVPLPVGPPHF